MMRWLFGTLLIAFVLQTAGAAADPSRRGGRKAYWPCNVCHSFTPGNNGWGPSLAGLFDRKIGTAPKFEYSPGMLAAGSNGATWDDDALDAFLTKPTDFIADTAMRFPGFPNPEDRRKVIAYLKHRVKR